MGKQQARGKEEDAERGKTESTEAKGEAMEVDGEREVKAGTDGEAAEEEAGGIEEWLNAGVFEAPPEPGVVNQRQACTGAHEAHRGGKDAGQHLPSTEPRRTVL